MDILLSAGDQVIIRKYKGETKHFRGRVLRVRDTNEEPLKTKDPESRLMVLLERIGEVPPEESESPSGHKWYYIHAIEQMEVLPPYTIHRATTATPQPQ